MTMQPATECKPYERPWRDWAVDRNLEDHWLERLNDLETLSLVSVCEGHLDVQPNSVKSRPCIILRPKKNYMRPLTVGWYDLKVALAAEIERIWPDDESIVEFEIQHRLVKNGDHPADIEDIIIRITSERKRDIMILTEWLAFWFQLSLIRIRVFDRFMKTLIVIKGEQG
ncbi:MAG: hypothetical protein FD159_2175 [Syntrophaceae bacterium]|nr:MAG: hypothetical protein FD159_2175 [Syntrophaceae bacterium]